jgi:hypothetical protein
MGGYQQFLSSQAPSRARHRPTPQTISVAVLDEAGSRRIRKQDVLPYVLSAGDDSARHAPSRPPREDHLPQCEDHPSVIYDDGDLLTPDTVFDTTDPPDIAAEGETTKNTEQVIQLIPYIRKLFTNIMAET